MSTPFVVELTNWTW